MITATIFVQTQQVSSKNIETGGNAINMTPDLIDQILTLHNTERAKLVTRMMLINQNIPQIDIRAYL